MEKKEINKLILYGGSVEFDEKGQFSVPESIVFKRHGLVKVVGGLLLLLLSPLSYLLHPWGIIELENPGIFTDYSIPAQYFIALFFSVMYIIAVLNIELPFGLESPMPVASHEKILLLLPLFVTLVGGTYLLISGGRTLYANFNRSQSRRDDLYRTVLVKERP